MTPEEEPLWSKSTSKTPINTRKTLNISSLLKVNIQDNTSSVEERLKSPLETSFPSPISPKEPPSATSSLQSVIKAHTLDALAPMPPLSDTLKERLESDFHLVQERPSPEAAEPQSVSLQEEDEMRSQS